MIGQNGSGLSFDIPEYIDNMKVAAVIGSGCSCVVVKAVDTKTDTPYAVKIITREQLKDESFLSQFEQELRTLESVKHPNIVALERVIYEKDFVYVVTEYCPYDLCTLIENGRIVSGSMVRKTFRQICEALNYLHKRGIYHHDLKPENIFVCEDGTVKLGDFGSCIWRDLYSVRIVSGTLYYLAPELLLGGEYEHEKTDIWSLGVILYMLLTSCLPWPRFVDNDLIKEKIIAANYKIPFHVNDVYASVITKCMSVDPKARPSCEEILANKELFKGNGAKKEKVVISCANSFVKRKMLVRPDLKKIKTWKSGVAGFCRLFE